MSAALQPDPTPPDPAAAGAGQPPTSPPTNPPSPPGPTETTLSPDDRFYSECLLSRSNPQEVTIGDRDVGIVLAGGTKSAPRVAGTYLADALLPHDAESGTLFAVRSGAMLVDLAPLTVQSLDRADVDVELCCAVQVTSPRDLIVEREPEAKLEIVVASAVRSVFGRYTAVQLNGAGPNPPDSATLIQAIRDLCTKDFQAGRGVAGLEIQRLDFNDGWAVNEEDVLEAEDPPSPAPSAASTPTSPPSDDAQLLDLLHRNPELLKEVVAACLSEATSLGMLPADARRFDAIQAVQARLSSGQRMSLRQMLRGALPDFKGGGGSGTP